MLASLEGALTIIKPFWLRVAPSFTLEVDTLRVDTIHTGGGGGITAIRTGSATWNPGNINGGGRDSKSVTVTGAATTDVAICGFDTIGGTSDVLRCVAQITAADTCEATLHNMTTGTAQDLGSGTVRCIAFTVS